MERNDEFRSNLQLPGMQSRSPTPPTTSGTSNQDMSHGYCFSPPPLRNYSYRSASPITSNYKSGFLFRPRNILEERPLEHNSQNHTFQNSQLQVQLQQRHQHQQLQQQKQQQQQQQQDQGHLSLNDNDEDFRIISGEMSSQVDAEIAADLNSQMVEEESSTDDEKETSEKEKPKRGKENRKGNGKKQKEEKEEKVWKTDEIEKLIRLWEDQPALYQVNHPDFIDRGKRSLIMDKIADDLKTTQYEIGKKMKGMRGYWQSVKNSLVGVSGQAAKKGPKWIWFDSLSFLDQRMVRSTESPTHEGETDGEMIGSRSRLKNGKRKRSAEDQQMRHNDLFEKLIDTVEKDFAQPAQSTPVPVEAPPDEDKQFGLMIATRLSKIPECDRKDQVKLDLLQLLMTCAKDVRNMDQ